MNVRFLAFGIATLCCIAAWPLHAQVPQIINYQGRLVTGTTNFNGTGQFKFALVNTNGSTTYWSNDNTSSAGSEPTNAVSLAVSNGLYSVLLGDTSIANMTNAIPASVFNNSDVRLRVWFNDGTHGSQLLTPDQRVAAVGYAIIAAGAPFSGIASGTNTSALVVGTGGSLSTSGTGTIAATSAPASGLTGTTLPAGLTASSLTSVGTLSSLNASGAIITSGNISTTGTGGITAAAGFTGNGSGLTSLSASNISTGTLGTGNGGTGLSSSGASGNLLQSNGSVWTSVTPSFLTSEADGVIGNEVLNATNATLTRSGSGTTGSPFMLALNLGNPNNWTASQTFSASLTASAGIVSNPGIATVPGYSFIGDTNTGMFSSALDTLNFSTGGVSQMSINPAGRVGIGTNAPETDLHVTRQSAGTITANANAVIALENNNSAYLNFLVPDADESGILFGMPTLGAANGGVIYNNNAALNGLQFRTNGNVTRMTITSAGDVGIGTNAPTGKLQVVGSGDASVVLPTNAVSSDEILDEPGLASKRLTGFSVVGASLVNITSRAITAPSDGYVVAIGTLDVWGDASIGNDNNVVVGVSTASSSLPSTQTSELTTLGGGKEAIVTVHGVFPVTAGSHTIFLLVKRSSGGGTPVAGDARLTLTYLPTAYGTVDPD